MHPTRDITGAATSADVRATLISCGYVRQIGPELPSHDSAEIVVWTVDDPELPPYYIEVLGATRHLACLVAEDFAHLASTLQMLGPLISLVALDGHSEARGAKPRPQPELDALATVTPATPPRRPPSASRGPRSG